MCRSRQHSFGLNNDTYMKAVYEQFFYLKYYGGWSFFEAYNLPIKLRTWFMERLAKQLASEKEQMDKAKSKNKK